MRPDQKIIELQKDLTWLNKFAKKLRKDGFYGKLVLSFQNGKIVHCKTMEIIFCSKEKVWPYFGYAIPRAGVAYVRVDLPRCVRKFVAAHEEYHLYDTAENWVYREFRATAFLDWRVFPGFIGACLMSLTPARLGLVCRRIRGRRWRNSRQGRVE